MSHGDSLRQPLQHSEECVAAKLLLFRSPCTGSLLPVNPSLAILLPEKYVFPMPYRCLTDIFLYDKPLPNVISLFIGPWSHRGSILF